MISKISNMLLKDKKRYTSAMTEQALPWPGFEPGLLRPQRRVLTTRRSRQLVSTRRHMAYEGQKSAPPWKSRKRCATLTRLATDCKEFSWCSGYHICLTHRRSPVRSRAKTIFKHQSLSLWKLFFRSKPDHSLCMYNPGPIYWKELS